MGTVAGGTCDAIIIDVCLQDSDGKTRYLNGLPLTQEVKIPLVSDGKDHTKKDYRKKPYEILLEALGYFRAKSEDRQEARHL